MSFWILLLILLMAGIIAFVLIAKKGRALRTAHATGTFATRATLSWMESGKEQRVNVVVPFYLGKNPESDIMLAQGNAGYEACIFYHDRRFAIQTFEGSAELQINGQEITAGYLENGDCIEIAGRNFVFRCY